MTQTCLTSSASRTSRATRARSLAAIAAVGAILTSALLAGCAPLPGNGSGQPGSEPSTVPAVPDPSTVHHSDDPTPDPVSTPLPDDVFLRVTGTATNPNGAALTFSYDIFWLSTDDGATAGYLESLGDACPGLAAARATTPEYGLGYFWNSTLTSTGNALGAGSAIAPIAGGQFAVGVGDNLISQTVPGCRSLVTGPGTAEFIDWESSWLDENYISKMIDQSFFGISNIDGENQVTISNCHVYFSDRSLWIQRDYPNWISHADANTCGVSDRDS